MEVQIKREIAVLDQIFSALDDFIEETGLGDSVAFGTRLTVEELFTNLVRHNKGGSDHIAISVEIESGKLVIALEDYDVEPVDMRDIKPADLAEPWESRRAGGFGIHLIRNFVDDLNYEFRDGTLRITAVKNLEEEDVRH